MTKQQLIDGTVKHHKEAIALSDYIYDHPELGNEEVKAQEALCEALEKAGFEIETGIAGLPTAFKATYWHRVSGDTGTMTTIGLLCEYDALEGFGHGCAHHLQGPVMVAVAKTLKQANLSKPFKLEVYGTPGEETTAGKIDMCKAGIFKELDIALMVHGSDKTCVDEKSLALTEIELKYYGVPAHSAIGPDKGRSALDAVLMTFNGVEYMREHMPADVRIHGIITDGGKALNIIPEFASCEFGLRAESRQVLDGIITRFKKIAKASCEMTETSCEMKHLHDFHNKIPSYLLNDIIMKNAAEMKCPNLSEPRKRTGSTDFANVMYDIPGSCLRIAFVDSGVTSHTKGFLEAGKSPAAHNAILMSAQTLVGTLYDLISDRELVEKIKREHQNQRKNQ